MTRAGLRRTYADVPPEAPGAVGSALGALFTATIMAPAVHENLAGLGLEPGERYFPCRAAPLGRASHKLVVSTFFNFSPAAVGRSIPHVWDKASPGTILTAQLDGLDRTLADAFRGLDTGLVAEAAALVRRAAESAVRRPEGRPLFAAWAELPWPQPPHLVLWHGFYLLREFRGDGHIAVLTAEGLSGIEALALYLARMPALSPILRPSRGWTDEEWDACLDGLREEGWLTDAAEPTFTAEGKRRRDAVEAWTDELDAVGYGSIGSAGCERLIELGEPITKALLDADLGFQASRLRPG